MTNTVAVDTTSEIQNIAAVAELPIEMLALVGGGDGAVCPF